MLYEPRQRFGVAVAGTAFALFALSSIRTSHVIVTVLYLVLCLGFIILPAFTLKDRAMAYEHRHLIGGVVVGWLAFISWNVLNVLTSPTSSDVIGLILGAFIGSLASIIALRVIRKPPAPATI